MDIQEYSGSRSDMLEWLHSRPWTYLIEPRMYGKTFTTLQVMCMDMTKAKEESKTVEALFVSSSRRCSARAKMMLERGLEDNYGSKSSAPGPSKVDPSMPENANVTFCAYTDMVEHLRGVDDGVYMYFDDVDRYLREFRAVMLDVVIPLMMHDSSTPCKVRITSRDPVEQIDNFMIVMTSGLGLPDDGILYIPKKDPTTQVPEWTIPKCWTIYGPRHGPTED